MSKSFDEWFNSPNEGGFGLKSEYFYEDLKLGETRNIEQLLVSWLRYAYESGREAEYKAKK